MGKLRFQHLQSAFVTCAESNIPDDDQKFAITSFVDEFITCSLRNPSTREIAKQVQTHNHTFTCSKMGSSKCRFNFPRFPCLQTIVAVPLRLIFGDDEEGKKKELMKMRTTLHKVKEVLEDKVIMTEVNKMHQDEIEEIFVENDLSLRAKHILEDQIFRKQIQDYSEDFDGEVKSDNSELGKALVENLETFYKEHFENYKTLETRDHEYRKERLLQVLTLAKIDDDLEMDKSLSFEEYREQLLEKYHQLLGYSTKGFTVNLVRDTNECYINNFNHEWLACWNSNMDLSVVFDFFAILTYVR